MKRIILKWTLCALVLFLAPHSVLAAFYNYQTYPGQGVAGAIGNATLGMSNGTTTVYANLVKGIGSFSGNLVIFIDCAPGGYTSTAPFCDKNNAQETAISGFGSLRSVATFAPGFEADYALVLGINIGSGLYKLVDDGTGPHLQLVRSSLNLAPIDSPNQPSYSFRFDWADLGLPSQRTNFFKFESSYITANGYRWLESFEGITGTQGYDFITFTNYDTYGVQPVPENTTTALVAFGGIAVAVTIGTRLRRRFVRASPAREPPPPSNVVALAMIRR